MTVGLAAVLLTVFSVMFSGTVLLRRSQNAVQAANVIQEEMESLRLLPTPELTDRTEGNFLNVLVNRGEWRVTDGTADGQGLRIALPAAAQTAIVGETGLIALPANWQEDFAISAMIRVRDGSPVGWGGGLAFRYRDAENHYRFRFTAGGLAFDTVRNGIVTTVWSQGISLDTDAWYRLEIAAAGNEFALKRDGMSLATVIDSEFTVGETALISLNGAQVEADDITLTVGETAEEWNFEDDDPDAYPEEWRRLGWSDLPSGTGTLTIGDYLDEPTLRAVGITVTWREKGETKSLHGATVIRNP
ncbi:hypothetical protein JW899_01820 [Candidatus Uhrbacteria bacterium]|nr:hypothetical protein [Candidatus Uhrbacteria bacterium]